MNHQASSTPGLITESMCKGEESSMCRKVPFFQNRARPPPVLCHGIMWTFSIFSLEWKFFRDLKRAIFRSGFHEKDYWRRVFFHPKRVRELHEISLIHSSSSLCNSWRSAGLITRHYCWNKIKSFIVAYCLLLHRSKFFFLCWLPSLFSVQHNSFTRAFFCVTGSPNPSGFERLWVKRILGLDSGLGVHRRPNTSKKRLGQWYRLFGLFFNHT